MNQPFKLGEENLNVETCIQIIRKEKGILLTEKSKQIINESAQRVENIVNSDQTVYGINTGFGPLCTVKITKEETRKLQENILKSHAVGVGNPLEDNLVRLMLLTKLHALSKGFSGIQLQTVERIQFLFENDILPQVPAQGSVGASGDLAPLSHLFLPLIGLGKVKFKNEIVATEKVYQELNLKPIDLGAKEGLALINGTQFILAHAVWGVHRMGDTLENADLIGALMLDALKGSTSPFKKELHEIRPYEGTQQVAENLRNYLADSEIPASHKNCDRVQDPYSLRCMPQVHGASRNAWKHLKELTEIELNAVTDNPIITLDGEAISGGNFHGQPLAMVLDYAALATAELGNIADRRVYLSLEGEKVGQPKLLLKETGLNSGFMIWQYTTAALVTENKSLLFPASGDSVPTSMGQEDHVSMGSISGRKLHMILDNVEKIQAIELLTACQALDFNRPLKTSPILEKIHSKVREIVPFFEKDEFFGEYIEKGIKLIQKGNLKK
ncbi:histidine ammonia-lyase [Candidatus Ornithobacterium hominis]|uniref:histidine ammonia-lyase n=1 Tax=Candidatus Ornithobacterium hominis TaxID=2497989 RepID=UPI0024BC9447|nr:histidine ammonia-lyase [Candidatus Ornithobacterium hominis]CAI9428997.1 histidine ammonia-lyase [Candidatus Ornithobacterium hominis]